METIGEALNGLIRLLGIKKAINAAKDAISWARSAATWAVDTTFQVLSDPNVNLATAQQIFHRADLSRLQSLLSEVARRVQGAATEAEANLILGAAGSVFCKGAATVVRNVIFDIVKCGFLAIGQTDLAQVLEIWAGIFTNVANRDTMAFILERKFDLALFLIDLIEPAKLYATAFSTDGSLNGENTNGRDNRYNELDLSMAMNRHTVICQLQRMAQSLAHITLMGRENKSLDQLPMNTILRSDFNNSGNVILPRTITIEAPDKAKSHGEQWLFVNGICGEYFWLQLYCKKLRDTFNRDIRGIFNRSDGIIWDLIECAGERDIVEGHNTLIQRTPSSMAAQKALRDELLKALKNKMSKGYIVMIAYSQGCLLLRLVLQEFVKNRAHQDAMKARLRVFTFGNPSIDWMGRDCMGKKIYLCDHVNHTEHFANKKDFVAQLGVLRTDQEDSLRDLGYLRNNSLLFTNYGQDWIGHLFGTQYSLRAQEYVDGGRSQLFACADGRPMAGTLSSARDEDEDRLELLM